MRVRSGTKLQKCLPICKRTIPYRYPLMPAVPNSSRIVTWSIVIVVEYFGSSFLNALRKCGLALVLAKHPSHPSHAGVWVIKCFFDFAKSFFRCAVSAAVGTVGRSELSPGITAGAGVLAGASGIAIGGASVLLPPLGSQISSSAIGVADATSVSLTALPLVKLRTLWFLIA